MNLTKILNKVAAELTGRASTGPVIVGVNGIDTSGKTTFATSLTDYIESAGGRAQLIHLDDFHNPISVRRQGQDEIAGYINHAFDLRLLVDELLRPASAGKKIDKELRLLDLESDTFVNKQKYRIDRRTIVIVEGVLLYREPLDQYFDYRIFLQIDFSEMLRRAEERDAQIMGPGVRDRYERKYIPIQKRYIEQWQPIKRADLVIDNNDFRHPRVVK